MEINIQDYTRFVVTGVDVDGQRFHKEYPSTMSGAMTSFGINLWRGNVWGVLSRTGRRVRLKSVCN